MKNQLRTLALGLAALSIGAGSLAATTSAADGAASAPDRATRTALTFTIDDCEGCRVQLHQGLERPDSKRPRMWESAERTVRGGKVTFRIPTKRTWGMSATVVAPWEGHTGYLTTVAFRYAGKRVGDPVSLAEARAADAASACWAGTRRARVTVPVVVERVRVDGVHRKVPGSIAYTPTTEDWTSEPRAAWDGVLGSQDFDVCGQR
jgi:hypothetical protein